MIVNEEVMLLEKYLTTRAQTEEFCKPLKTEDYIPQAVEFASPPKWHLAHVSWFFEEMILKKFMLDYQRFHPQFGYLFNSYYRSVGDRAIRHQRGIYSRPTVEEVYQYRAYVDDNMKQLFAEPICNDIKSLVYLGINHEQQHQELLLTDLKYVFGLNPLLPVYDAAFNLVNTVNDDQGWLSIPEGEYSIGHCGDGFCFDNELGQHTVLLPSFQIAQSLVTNGDYIEFIEAGGYECFQYWLDEGWTWLKTNDICHPLYWQKIDGNWYSYTLAGLKAIDSTAELAHISYYEADAFANWKNMRLPTEFEWEAASHQFKWGSRWEWTSSPYQAYPGFKVSRDAVGEYNGKFMINQVVLRGASTATAIGHSRHTYRNFFHPHMQWQYSGIRLAK